MAPNPRSNPWKQYVTQAQCGLRDRASACLLLDHDRGTT
jgi:hypothetical protein